MAQLFRTFDNDTVDAAPSGITAWADGDISDLTVRAGGGEQYLEMLHSSAGRYAYTLDAVSASSITEVFIEFEFATAISGQVRGIFRLDPLENTANATATYYIAGARSDQNKFIGQEYNGGSLTTHGEAAISMSTATRYHQVSRVNSSNQLQGNFWPASGPEASSNLINSTDPNFPLSSGLAGFGSTVASNVKIYSIGIGTDGDAAPRGALGPTVTVDAPLTPGGTTVLTYSDFDAVPTGTATATPLDGSGDPISGFTPLTYTGTVDDTDTAGVHSGAVTVVWPDLKEYVKVMGATGGNSVASGLLTSLNAQSAVTDNGDGTGTVSGVAVTIADLGAGVAEITGPTATITGAFTPEAMPPFGTDNVLLGIST